MRGYTVAEQDVLSDADGEPLDEEEWAIAGEVECSFGPESESAIESLLRRGCITPQERGFVRVFNLTPRGVIALALVRAGLT